MNIEQQVTSLELSKQLKELGINNKSILGWVLYDYGNKQEFIVIKGTNDLYPISWGGDRCKLQEQKDKEISAYTASELMEILPNSIFIKEQEPFGNFRLKIGKFKKVENDIELLDKEKYQLPVLVKNNYTINYECDTRSLDNFVPASLMRNIYDEKFCDALAKTIITLHKLGYIK